MSATAPCFQALLDAVGLGPDAILTVARRCGFVKRIDGKIAPGEFVYALCQALCLGTVSCNDLAVALQAAGGANVSRQAVALRFGESCVAFFKSLLEAALQHRSGAGGPVLACLERFKRIVLQDSTLVRLPGNLMAEFGGVRNATGQACNARVQTVYDLLSGRFQFFRVDKYKRNDQAAAGDLQVEEGDLVLRDRGYFDCASIQGIIDAGADLIYRHKHGVTLYYPASGEALDLLRILRRDKRLDMKVRLTAGGPVLRLIAAPVDQETANLRRMRLKRDTKGHAPSAELLALCDWSIYLTTLDDEALSLDDLRQIYGLRWRIECIFKAWKSQLNFAQYHPISVHQAYTYMYARLLSITLLTHCLYLPLATQIATRTPQTLSLQKFIRYAIRNATEIPLLLTARRLSDPAMKPLLRYCCYDKRKRRNFEQELECIVLLFNTLQKHA
jgi:hypothetical protein